jgi:hypothetical protein
LRRLVFLICIVALMFDLADDGYLGKVKFVEPTHTAKYSVASPHQNSGPDNSQAGLPPENSPDFLDRLSTQSVSLAIAHGFKISDCYLLSSSGGLPR